MAHRSIVGKIFLKDFFSEIGVINEEFMDNFIGIDDKSTKVLKKARDGTLPAS